MLVSSCIKYQQYRKTEEPLEQNISPTLDWQESLNTESLPLFLPSQGSHSCSAFLCGAAAKQVSLLPWRASDKWLFNFCNGNCSITSISEIYPRTDSGIPKPTCFYNLYHHSLILSTGQFNDFFVPQLMKHELANISTTAGTPLKPLVYRLKPRSAQNFMFKRLLMQGTTAKTLHTHSFLMHNLNTVNTSFFAV